MGTKLILAFASVLLVQTIAGQNTNTGVVEVNNLNIAGNGISLSNNGNDLSGYGSGYFGNSNAGIVNVANGGVNGNGISLGNGVGLSNNGYSFGSGYGSGFGFGYGSGYGSDYGSISTGSIDVTNIGIAGNGISLANNVGYGNQGLINGIGYGNLGLANGVGYSNLGLANGVGYSNLGLANGVGYGNIGLGFSGIGNNYGNTAQSLSYGSSFGNGYGTNINCGAFPVSCSSPLAPTGLAVVSENAIDGAVNINGALPFLSAVTLEGGVASGGSAGVQYSCGNGNIGIVSENVGSGNIGNGAGIGYGTGFGAGYGLGAPLGGTIVVGSSAVNNYGCGCGLNY